MNKAHLARNAADTFTHIENAAHDGAFGHNSRPIPSDAQCAAGNYKVGRAVVYGIPIAIEQPRHSYRTGIDRKTGKRWTTKLAAHYGYFSGTKGADGDAVDCFVGFYPQSEHAWVINQHVGGRFDEHKVMLAFPDEETARRAYLDSYEKGWTGLHSLVHVTIPQLQWWLRYGNHRKPLLPASLPDAGPSADDFYQRLIDKKDAEIARLTKALISARRDNEQFKAMLKNG